MTSPTTLDAEKTDLLTEIALARRALTSTVRDLSDGQLGEHPTASALCLGGLIKHVASVEEGWQNFIVEGPSAMSYDLPDGVTWADMADGTANPYPQWAIEHANEFQMQPGDTMAGILARYEEVARRTEEIVSTVDLSVSHPLPEAPWNEPGAWHSARRVLMHLIAETSQHAGHADVIRESLDGQTAG